MREVILTRHAASKMRDRDVSIAEVKDLLRNYRKRISSFSHAGRDTPFTYIYQGDDLAVVVSEEDPQQYLIITVLLPPTEQRWTDEDARNRKKETPDMASKKIILMVCDAPDCSVHHELPSPTDVVPGYTLNGGVVKDGADARPLKFKQVYACSLEHVAPALDAVLRQATSRQRQ